MGQCVCLFGDLDEWQPKQPHKNKEIYSHVSIMTSAFDLSLLFYFILFVFFFCLLASALHSFTSGRKGMAYIFLLLFLYTRDIFGIFRMLICLSIRIAVEFRLIENAESIFPTVSVLHSARWFWLERHSCKGIGPFQMRILIMVIVQRFCSMNTINISMQSNVCFR